MIPKGNPYAVPLSTAVTSGAPVNIAPDFSRFARDRRRLDSREAVAQALFERGMKPDEGKMVGGYYVSGGLPGLIGNLASAGAGAFLSKNLEDKRAELESEESKAVQQVIQSLAADPQLASQYISSPNKTISGFASQMVKDSTLSRKDMAALAKDFTPESIERYFRGQGSLERNPDVAFVNDVAVDKTRVKPGDSFGDKQIDRRELNGDLYAVMQRPDGSTYDKKLDNSTKVSNTVINSPQGRAQDSLRAANDKRLEELSPVAREAPSRIRQLDEAKALVNDGVVKGVAAPLVSAYGQLIQSFGGKLPQGVENLEAYRQRLLPFLLDEVRKLAPVTDTDRAFLAQYNGFDSTKGSDRDVLSLIDYLKDRSVRDVTEYNRRAGIAGKLASQQDLTQDEINSVYQNIYPAIELENTDGIPARGGMPRGPAAATVLGDEEEALKRKYLNRGAK